MFFRKTGTKETMSPLDYVNNLIMEKMRTENSDEKAEDDKSKTNHDSNSANSANNSSSTNSHQSTSSTQPNHIGSFSGHASMMEDRSSNSAEPPQRYSEASQVSPTPV